MSKTCDDCICMLKDTGKCWCAESKHKVDPSKLDFPKGSRFGVADIRYDTLVVTSDSMIFAQRQALKKGYYRFVIQP